MVFCTGAAILRIINIGKLGPRAIFSNITVIAVADAAIISTGDSAKLVPGTTPARRNMVMECAKLKLSKISRLDPTRLNKMTNFLIT